VRILVAATSFKGTLSAIEATAAITAGIRRGLPGSEVIECPVADGGDGTLEVLIDHLSGELVELQVTGPLGSPIDAAFGLLETEIAVIELARASGLALLEKGKLDPLHATSRGTGELISAALDHHPRRVIVGAGGSATTDAGVGMLQALGVGFFDDLGRPIGPGAAGLLDLARVDVTFRDKRLFGTEMIVACDVANPLLGPTGAARTFAPQKGASEAEVEEIEEGIERFAEIVMNQTGYWVGETPRGGAAGGAASGLLGLAASELRAGFDVISEMIDFDRLLESADLVIVGEGRLDSQSLAGKAPIAAARLARAKGVPVLAFAGSIDLTKEELIAEGIGSSAALEDFARVDGATAPGLALTGLVAEEIAQLAPGR